MLQQYAFFVSVNMLLTPPRIELQVITQLAATQSSIFSGSQSNVPRAIIFVMDQQERYQQYEIVFEGEIEREWRSVIMPKAIRFYLDNMLPRIQARMSLSDLADVLPSPPRRRPSLPTSRHVSEKIDVSLISPTLKEGKRVQRLQSRDFGVIKKIDMDTESATLDWENKTQQRMRPVKLKSLVVAPLGDEQVVQPDRLNQEVMIIGGSRQDLLSKKGIIVSLSAHQCRVHLYEGPSNQEPVAVNLKNVTAVDGARKVTVPPKSESVSVELDKLEEWISEYEQINKVKLVGKVEVATFVSAVKQKAVQFESEAQKASKRRRSANKLK